MAKAIKVDCSNDNKTIKWSSPCRKLANAKMGYLIPNTKVTFMELTKAFIEALIF